jgi:hypothetical protein
MALLELEEKHGGMSRQQIRAKLLHADEPCEKHGTLYPNKYAIWGLAAEVQSWGYALPTGQQLFDALFADMPIEWNRIGAFQDVTLRLIATRIIQSNEICKKEVSTPAFSFSAATSRSSADGGKDSVFVQGELANQRPSLRKPVGDFHIYCSEHNPGSMALMTELSNTMGLGLHIDAVKQQTRQRRRTPMTAWSTSRALTAGLDKLYVSSEIAALHKCDNMLVYLDDQTWTRGESGSDQFVADVHQAMDAGVPLLLAHEMVGVGQGERRPCEFGNFFVCDRGTTPPELLHRGIYDAIATPLKGLEWRQASMVMLLNALTPGGTLEANARVMRAEMEQQGLLHRISIKPSRIHFLWKRPSIRSWTRRRCKEAPKSTSLSTSTVGTIPAQAVAVASSSGDGDGDDPES